MKIFCHFGLLIGLLSLFGISQSWSQPYYSDFGSWNTFNAEYKINKSLSAVFTEECRIKENLSVLNLFYTNIGISVSPFKFWKSSLVYRSIEKYREDYHFFSYRHRLMWDNTFKYKLNDKLSVSYRHRLQAEVRNVYSSADGGVPEWYSRNKIETKYSATDKLSPYISAEFRYQLHDPRNIESDHYWHRDRYAIGADYDLNKNNTFGLYYLIQREYNVSLPENLFIIGLEYSVTFGSKN